MDIKKIPDAIGNKVKNFTENSPVVKKALEGAFEQAKDILVEENTKPMPEEVKIGIDLALGIGIFAILTVILFILYQTGYHKKGRAVLK